MFRVSRPQRRVFFKFQGFSRFFNVFLRFFHVSSGFFRVFLNFKGKIVFGDPPCLKLRPPLERESLPQKTPQKGPQAWPRPSMKMRIFSTEIEGSGWPLVFWVFVFFKFFQDFSATFFIMILSEGGGGGVIFRF